MHGISHVRGGPDPIPGLPERAPGGDTIDAIIEGLDPAGFWKLDESSGIVAHDSSGNGLDLTDDYTAPPLWGAAAGPPGAQAADFANGTGGVGGTAARVARAWAPITSSFTAAIWVNRHSTASTHLMGQGNPDRSGGTGWMLALYSAAFTAPDTSRPYAQMAGGGHLSALNPLAPGTWAFLAVTYDHTTTRYRLYVNGLLEATSAPFTFASVSSWPLWIGHDGHSGVLKPDFTGSYAFLVPSVLTGAQLLDVYNSAAFPGGADEGKALLATGTGGSYWDFPLQVTY